VFLDKLTGPQLNKKLPASYDFHKFITAFKIARHLSLSCAQLIQCMPLPRFLNIGSNIFLPSTPRSSKCTLYLQSPHRNPVRTCPVTYTSNLPNPSHSSSLDHSSKVFFFFCFHSSAVHLDMITSLFIKLNAKLYCSLSQHSVHQSLFVLYPVQ